jgi:hypothetical protein
MARLGTGDPAQAIAERVDAQGSGSDATSQCTPTSFDGLIVLRLLRAGCEACYSRRAAPPGPQAESRADQPKANHNTALRGWLDLHPTVGPSAEAFNDRLQTFASLRQFVAHANRWAGHDRAHHQPL